MKQRRNKEREENVNKRTENNKTKEARRVVRRV